MALAHLCMLMLLSAAELLPAFGACKPAIGKPLTVVVVDAEEVRVCRGWVDGQQGQRRVDAGCCSACTSPQALQVQNYPLLFLWLAATPLPLLLAQT